MTTCTCEPSPSAAACMRSRLLRPGNAQPAQQNVPVLSGTACGSEARDARAARLVTQARAAVADTGYPLAAITPDGSPDGDGFHVTPLYGCFPPDRARIDWHCSSGRRELHRFRAGVVASLMRARGWRTELVTATPDSGCFIVAWDPREEGRPE